MNLSFDLTAGHLVGIASGFISVLWLLVQIIVKQQEKRLEEKFQALSTSMGTVGNDLRRETDATRMLETAFLRFQAELPRDYVRRDDFVRTLATLETRIDNFALRMERALSERKE